MLKTAILICLNLFQIVCYSQQSIISVQSFDYIWQNKLLTESTGSEVNILLKEEYKRAIEKSFLAALQQRWKTEISPFTLKVKSFSLLSFSPTPKFNTKLKEKQPGTWYLFLQMFADGNAEFHNEDGSIGTPIYTKIKIVSAGDSVIFERNLTVKMNIEKAPSDQVVLERLKAHPSNYLKAFDSIAVWLFQPENITKKDVWLKPACVFMERNQESPTITRLIFENSDTMIHQLTQPQYLFQTTGPTFTKQASNKNAGGNTASGAVTLFTGISINKVKINEYAASFPFKEDDGTVYNCIVNYAEKESSVREREKTVGSDGSKSYSLKSGAYSLSERRTDSQYVNIITRGTDTVANFTIHFTRNANNRSHYKQLWDGIDSASIIDLPDEWNNKSEEDNIMVRVTAADKVFYMETKEENNVKVFYIQDKPALIMYGKLLPSTARVLQPVSALDLKICTMLASLPYAYFNYSAL